MAYFNNIFSYRHLAGARTVFYIALLTVFAVFGMCSLSALAQEDPYTVEEIEVDVTADNAVAAREKAFEEAQIKGYQMLAERLLPPEALAAFEAPDINTVSALVQDFEVTNEKLSAVRYKGIYKIRYSRQVFGGQGVVKAAMPSGVMADTKPDTLVVPFYEVAGRSVLWQMNPFMEAWSRARGNKTLGRAIVPIGDIEDLAQVKDDQALTYDPARLNAMRLRYQARQAAVIVASPEIQSDGTQNILISLYDAKPYGPVLAQQFEMPSYRGEVQEQVYNRIVAEVSKRLLAGGHNRQNLAVPDDPVTAAAQNIEPPLGGPVQTIAAQLNFTSVRQWVDTKRSIERARGVKSISVQSLSPRSAQVGITFVGDVTTLRGSLQKIGIGLNEPVAANGTLPLYQIYAGPARGSYVQH